MKFTSRFFKTPKDLVSEILRLSDNSAPRRAAETAVREFYNGKDLATMKDAEARGTDVVNHLVGYRNLKKTEDASLAIYTTTQQLIQIKVRTGRPEDDDKASQILTNYINEAIYHSGEFENVWASVAGEQALTGKGPLTFPRYGWCPKFSPNILLPENAPGVAKKLTYAADPVELTMSTLTSLENSANGEKNRIVDVATVKQLKKALEKQIKGEGTVQTTSMAAKEIHTNVLKEVGWQDEDRTTLKAWMYYEVYYSESKKTEVVSATLITEHINLETGERGKDGDPVVISHAPMAYESPTHWFHPMIVDSQIGGLKTYSAARGMGELTYPSDMDSEELLNEMIAGEKLRARPKFKMGKEANKKSVDEWDAYVDSVLPHDLEPAQVYGGNNLGQPLALLTQISSGLTGGSFSNVGRDTGELRIQGLERQNQNASSSHNRMSAIYTALTRLAGEIVRRFLIIKVKPGTEGYDDIMWVRECLEEKKVPYKDLAEIKHGRFRYLLVSVTRSIGAGDRDSELAVATELMKNIEQFEPEVRPLIRRKWVMLVTRDPDLAERLSTLPELVINAQKLVAENECDTIFRRAVLGQQLPVGTDDIDEDHLPVHLLDLQAFLTESAYRQFTELDLNKYAGMVDHITSHLQRLASVGETGEGAAKVYQVQLQRLTAAAQPIIDQVSQQQEQPAGMSPKEQTDFLFKQQQLQLAGQKHGLEEAKFEANEQQRRAREHRADRGQYAKEVNDQEKRRQAKVKETQAEKKLRLEKEKLEHEKSKPQPKPAAKK